MSIIEKAAQRMGGAAPVPPVPPASEPTPTVAGEPEASLIERSIDVAAASFGMEEEKPSPPRFARPMASDGDDGPATVWGGAQVARIDLDRLRDMGMLTPEAGRSKIAEEYRLIKRPLLARAFGQGEVERIEKGNLIMVTSSLPGEGKSFTALNLAISMATEMENTVLLVDADVTKSAITRYLDIKSDKGLLDVLRNPRLQLSEILIKTDIAKLTILPAGQTFSHATELLASSAMRHFVDEIASRYQDRIIIFDTPPLLATSESSVLATYMGQIVFVVEAERTPQDAVNEALTHVANCENVGVLLNKVPPRSAQGDYYYYGYGYGYGYGDYAKQQ